MKLIGELETAFGITAEKEMLPMQPGDVTSTWADCTALERDTGYKPNTPIRDGIRAFVEWYRSYHGS
jgi:UDP-glucuronate 4-epimerase